MKPFTQNKALPEQALCIRELFQQREKSFLSEHGTPSALTTRRNEEKPGCNIRTPFQLDRDRIVYSNSFRRLKYKTQVFLSPLGDHYRTRLTHTLEVSEIARNIARAMRLNEDLAEAIALGHDLGHTPFGHGGETALTQVHSPHFSHSDQSLRVVDTLENRGRGEYLYSCKVTCGAAGGYGFTTRIISKGDDWIKHTPGLITWAQNKTQ